MSQALRIVFAGTPEFAAEHLKALLDTPHRIVAVYTQPDRPAGRGQKLMPSAVKSLALEHGLPVMQPQSLRNAEAQAELAALRADLMVVVAYGLILPQARDIEYRLGQDQAIGDHHHQVRAQRRQLRLGLGIAQALRLHDR